MGRDTEGQAPLHDPLADIEVHLIQAYLAGAGHTLEGLAARSDEAARQILAAASQYASERLSEIEARWRYLHELRARRNGLPGDDRADNARGVTWTAGATAGCTALPAPPSPRPERCRRASRRRPGTTESILSPPRTGGG